MGDEKMFVNKKFVKGTFPHKNKKCYKLVTSRGTQWVPCRDAVLAERLACSQMYIPVRLVAEQDKAREVGWTSRAGHETLVWVKDGPWTLIGDWRFEVCDGPASYWDSVQAGSVVHHGCKGNSWVSGDVWVVDP